MDNFLMANFPYYMGKMATKYFYDILHNEQAFAIPNLYLTVFCKCSSLSGLIRPKTALFFLLRVLLTVGLETFGKIPDTAEQCQHFEAICNKTLRSRERNQVD